MSLNSILNALFGCSNQYVDYLSMKPIAYCLSDENKEMLLVETDNQRIALKYIDEWEKKAVNLSESFYKRLILSSIEEIKKRSDNDTFFMFCCYEIVNSLLLGGNEKLGEDSFLDFCFQVMAAGMGVNDFTFSILLESFGSNTIIKKSKEIRNAYCKLCMRAGGRELFLLGHPLAALRYYRLSQTVLPESFSESPLDYYNLTKDSLEIYDSIYSNNAVIETLRIPFGFPGRTAIPTNILRTIYNQFFFGGLSYKEKIELVSCFYKRIEKNYNELSVNSSLRTAAFVFLKVKHYSLYYYLLDANSKDRGESEKGDSSYASLKKLMDSVISLNSMNCNIPYNLQFLYQFYSSESKETKNEKESDTFLSVISSILDYSEIVDSLICSLRLDLDTIKDSLCYYTSLKALNYILPSQTKSVGRIPIMNTSYMNDPNEGKIIWNYLYGTSKGKSESKERRVVSTPFVFIKSFTTNIDNLPMWKMYGDNTRGCCIVLNKSVPFITTYNDRYFIQDYETDSIKKTNYENDLVFPLYRILYVRIDERYNIFCSQEANSLIDKEVLKYIQQQLERLKTIAQKVLSKSEHMKILRTAFEKELTKLSYLVKDKSYSYEKEVRYLVESDGFSYEFEYTGSDFAAIDNIPKQFVTAPFPVLIHELILGPGVNNSSEFLPYFQDQFLKMYKKINRQGPYCPSITMSEIDYR